MTCLQFEFLVENRMAFVLLLDSVRLWSVHSFLRVPKAVLAVLIEFAEIETSARSSAYDRTVTPAGYVALTISSISRL